jgi:hypothetical protein
LRRTEIDDAGCNLARILEPLRHRTLVPLHQTIFELDVAAIVDARTEPVVEQLAADCELATVAGANRRRRPAPALAKTATTGKKNSGTRPSRYERNFGEDWYTSASAKTAGKSAGLVNWTRSQPANSSRSAQKAVSTDFRDQEQLAQSVLNFSK